MTTPAGVIEFRIWDDKDVAAEAKLTHRGEQYEIKGQLHPHGFYAHGAARPNFLDKRKVTEPQQRALSKIMCDAFEFANQNGYIARFKAFRAQLVSHNDRVRLMTERAELIARLAQIDAALAA